MTYHGKFFEKLRRSIFVFSCGLLFFGIVYYFSSNEDRKSNISRLRHPNRISLRNVYANDVFEDSLTYMPLKNATFGNMASISEKIVHLDLKGAPPTVHYYDNFFPFIKQLGATGLLVEYEDMFPYKDALQHLASDNAYSQNDIHYLQKLANKYNLEVIPLVQTFGHVEMALKNAEFQRFQEIIGYPNMICPSKPFAVKLVQEMVTQVMHVHPGVRRIHIGCDETWQLGLCPICQRRMKENGWNTTDLFLSHVSTVAKFVKNSFDVDILVWDDMFRKANISKVREYGLKGLVQPVIWNYRAWNFDSNMPDLTEYSKIFSDVWAASAFKGATASNAMVVNITHHLMNHIEWLKTFNTYQTVFEQAGSTFNKIIITGWQRYNHFGDLCELMPLGIPSLALSLSVLKFGHYDKEVLQSVYNTLHVNSESMPFGMSSSTCADAMNVTSSAELLGLFPGSDAYKDVTMWCIIRERFKKGVFDNPTILSWAGPYNNRFAYTSPFVLHTNIIPFFRSIVEKYKPFALAGNITKSLSEVYDKYTVEEWLFSNVDPLLRKITEMNQTLEKLSANRTQWPRQPLFENADPKRGS